MSRRNQFLLAALLIAGWALLVYWPILHSAFAGDLNPWGSDTLGHLLKVEFIAQELQAGNIYPQLFPNWYNGVLLLRYFPPLPYYLVATVYLATDNVVFAGGVFVFVAALIGGLSFLLYRHWMNLLPATVAGMLYVALPDNIRVALAEGNLPRVLATALLPITFYFLLSTLTRGPSLVRFLLLATLIMLVILSHAMMGAIFVACMTLVTLVLWFFMNLPSRSIAAALSGIYVGVLLSGWWLLPSLTGGITELNTRAAGEALVSFSVSTLLDPVLRVRDKEGFYLGAALVGSLGLSVCYWRSLNGLSRGLIAVSILVLMVSSTVFNPVYRTFPLHELMWPPRFMSFAGFIAIVGLLLWMSRLLMGTWKSKAIAVALTGLLFLDTYPSLSLVFVRPVSEDLVTMAEKVSSLPGWRVATVDFSRLGSRASYVLSTTGNREQVYGWAYQGSGIAPLLANINLAMARGYDAYAIDRLEELGTDYVLKLKELDISPSFETLLQQRGFALVQDSQYLSLYHREGGARAYTGGNAALGIGDAVHSFEMVFPSVVPGASSRVDDYSLELLQNFPVLILSGFSWHRKADAEALVKRYLAGGGKVIVDLTGVQEDVLSKRPRFLGVYGEPVALYVPPALRMPPDTLTLQSFDPQYLPWVTFTPQDLDGSTVAFSYLGQAATAVGYKDFEEGRAWFVGMNLPFHALLTKDETAIALLQELLGLQANAMPERETISLVSYEAGSNGYTFQYTLGQGNLLLVPIARHDGTSVSVDGHDVEILPVSSLLYFLAPGGTHSVSVRFHHTAIYGFGLATTIIGVLVIFGMAVMAARDRTAGSGKRPSGDSGADAQEPRHSTTEETP